MVFLGVLFGPVTNNKRFIKGNTHCYGGAYYCNSDNLGKPSQRIKFKIHKFINIKKIPLRTMWCTEEREMRF
ncbi:MAG: hypothetical protein ACFFG0_21465 [Candidatus Thorarchaeota archaeon]